ncbi:uncharacterized protein UMAG_12184 [Mycosarcoma maydis]|uniref:RlpA-like protein double-psi beta-barrel domain-containing protein n=1 Tax=Mycosarcoma maydis TaxID=5270 RepID=A0A0D1CT94_MYCMD|nr:uncharacterized protein UMAG_12184 [Ustilago maydis 521]KIS69738.1 hypothetical protein UMAG_12184 [Ustilago maydis 521]|eukprot:XP_011388913.1 hypothetical protein UMAG_12184 [Ustilago maydis 521]
MTCVKTLLFAFVALSITLMTVAQAAQPTISHNAAVRRHAAMMQTRPARRSVAVGDGKMMVQKRQTAEQIAQAADQKKWNDDFHAKNAEWQQAAIAALGKGQTPPSYDEYWSGKSSGSSSPSSSSADSSSSSSSSSSPSSSSSDTGSSDQSSTTPAKEQQQQQQQQQQVQTSSAAAAAATANTESTSTQHDSGSESDECEEDSTTDSTGSSAGPSSTSAKGAAAAAATGSKNHAAQNKPDAGSSSSSSEATSGHYGGQATYYAPGLGACGWTNGESDYIVAISASLFDSFGTGNPNKNPVCGHKIAATYGGKTITVSVADRCVGCGWGDLDFTPTGFSQLADMSKGRLDGLSWSWIGAGPK